jgi:hypothetical protein
VIVVPFMMFGEITNTPRSAQQLLVCPSKKGWIWTGVRIVAITQTNAIKGNLCQESDLDQALLRLLGVELSDFDPPDKQPQKQYPHETIGQRDHAQTALQTTREKNCVAFISTTLLRNGQWVTLR